MDRSLFAIGGLAVVIAALVFNTTSDLVGDVTVRSIFEVIYFLTIYAGIVLIAIGFVGKVKQSSNDPT
ncbi:MAG: hypothetical protein RBG13Loki_0454 [Promethearchaeota archaeon CR_4]|nr:MAG: hypothetical protein RBG13Loki_0454 [Candidatus Lokiarchaeota archaeon CR_4]